MDLGRRAAELPLGDGLALLLLASEVEPARFDRGVPRWHARLCSERQLSTAEAQLALAALNALPGVGAEGAAQALASICRRHDRYFAYSLTEDPPSAYAHLEGDPGTVESMLAVIREAFPLQPNIVFISWSGDPGQAVAAALADVIGARLPSGGDVFVTPRLPAGAAPIAEIESNLRRTTAHVAVMTPEAVESDWVLWELASSWAREVPVFPICVGIAPGELPDPVRLFLQAVRIEDTAGMERTFAELVTATGAVAGALSASDLEAIRRGKQ